MDLTLDRKACHVVNVNVRTEHHGEETKTACDIKLQFDTSNEFLSELHPTLKHSLYDKSDQADILDLPEHRTVLRFPSMKTPIKWEWEGVGYQLQAHIGVSGKADVLMNDCHVGKLSMEPKDGGTVRVCVTISAAATEQQIGALCGLLTTEAEISLTPPAASNDENKRGNDSPLFDQSSLGGEAA